MPNYNEADVKRVAEFVLGQSHYDQYDDNSDYTPQYCCDLCGATLLQKHDGSSYIRPDIKKFRHEPSCIYLVAQDLLN